MAATDAAAASRWGSMVSLRGTDIAYVDFNTALGKLKTVPQRRYDEAAMLFG
jgi:6-phosphofructokinase 1